MAESGLIAAYLTELRYSVARLADAEDIVVEADDHLVARGSTTTASATAVTGHRSMIGALLVRRHHERCPRTRGR